MSTPATTETPADPHPYAFTDMQEARQALRSHVQGFEHVFRDAGRIAGVVEALALANVEARLGAHEGIDQAFSYLLIP